MSTNDKAPGGPGASSESFDWRSNHHDSETPYMTDRRGTRPLVDRSIRLITADEIMTRPDPRFLVDGLLQEGGVAELFGEPGSGKTFVVLSLCEAIASGRPWMGREVLQGPVVYVAAEGSGGLGKRLKAIVADRGEPGCLANLSIVDRPVNLFRYDDDLRGNDVDRLVTVCSSLKPRLLVFDTLARSIDGADENFARDMAVVMKSFDRVRDDLSTSVLFVHHTIKKGTTDRGSGVIEGSVDTKVYVKGNGNGNHSLTISKQRNMEGSGTVVWFNLVTCEQSVVVREVSQNSVWTSAAALNGPDKAALRQQNLKDAIMRALGDAHSEGRTPMNQSALLRLVKGNAERKKEALQALVDSPNSGITVTIQGRSHLYSLSDGNTDHDNPD